MTTPATSPAVELLTLDYAAGWKDGHAAGIRFALETALLVVDDPDVTLHAPAIRELALMMIGKPAPASDCARCSV